MKEVILEISENKELTKDTFLLTLKGDLTSLKNPGEFVNLKLPDHYLRRPISVFDYEANELKLLYKVLGLGTKDLSTYQKGVKLNTLVNLGNGFTDLSSKKPLLIAGGIGLAPLYLLAKEFNKLNIKPTLIYGLRSKSELVLKEELEKYCNLIITTDDGLLGYHGNPVSYLKEHKLEFDKYYACGPLVMLKHLKNYSDQGYLSLEARMGCGFGACMGCSIKTTKGPRRVCKEGPVFKASEVIFDDEN